MRLVCSPCILLHLQKRVLPKLLPDSGLCLFECRGGSGSKIFPLTIKLVPIHSGSIHVLAVTDQHLQLAVGQYAGFNADESVPHLIQRDLRLNAIVTLVLLPALE